MKIDNPKYIWKIKVKDKRCASSWRWRYFYTDYLFAIPICAGKIKNRVENMAYWIEYDEHLIGEWNKMEG